MLSPRSDEEMVSKGKLVITYRRVVYLSSGDGMKITTIADVQSQPNPHHVDARKVYDTSHALAVVITLQPGEALKKHVTPVDVFFYVLEGTGVVEIGDEKAVCTKDMLIESPARIPHRWVNESNELFRVLVVKVPKPAEETKLL